MTPTRDMAQFLLLRYADEVARTAQVMLLDAPCPVCGAEVEEYRTPAVMRGWKPNRPDYLVPCGHELTEAQRQGFHVIMWQPQVVADITAKQAIVREVVQHRVGVRLAWLEYCAWLGGATTPARYHSSTDDPGMTKAYESVLRHLVQPYEQHPDFEPRWRL